MNANKVEALRLAMIGEQHVGRIAGGRVVHDMRGNAKWDWAVSSGVLAVKTVAELMNTLDVPALSIENEGEVCSERCDPYNRAGRRF